MWLVFVVRGVSMDSWCWLSITSGSVRVVYEIGMRWRLKARFVRHSSFRSASTVFNRSP